MLEGRSDLESAQSALRAAQNLTLDPYGAVTRRPGLRFVAEVSGACILFDPINRIPEWDSLLGEEMLTQVDQYGSLGFPSVKVSPVQSAFFHLCPFMDWCDGPEIEAAPSLSDCNRQVWRWRAMLADGIIMYGRGTNQLIQVPTTLIPNPMPDAVQLSIGFDGTGRAGFAVDRMDTGKVQLYRFESGNPVMYEWDGVCPVLFYNGLIQRDIAIADLVCYYIRAGELRMRFQRDLFAVEYTIANPTAVEGGNHLARLIKTDMGRRPNESYHYISAQTDAGRFLLFRSEAYQKFPVCVGDTGFIGITAEGGEYFLEIIDADPEDDAAGIEILADGGVYYPESVEFAPQSDSATSEITMEGGAYNAVAISSPAQQDNAVTEITINGGSYTIVIIAGGTYAEVADTSITIEGGSYTPV